MEKQNKNKKGKIGKFVGGLAVLTLVGTTAIAMSACGGVDANTPHEHNYTEHTAVLATCEQDGHAAYFTCAGCGKYFDASKVEINGVPTTNATGHAWQIEYNGTTGVYHDVCEHDAAHTRDVTPGADAEHPLLVSDVAALQDVVWPDGEFDASAVTYVQLTQDIELSQTLYGMKSTVIDMAGYALTIADGADFTDDALIKVWGEADHDVIITLTGNGTFDARGFDSHVIALWDGAQMVIDNGTFIGNTVAVYVRAGHLTVNGGQFAVATPADIAGKEYEFVLNCLDANYQNGSAQIVVKGGEFTKFNPQANGAESNAKTTNFVADGYTVEYDADRDVYTVVKA